MRSFNDSLRVHNYPESRPPLDNWWNYENAVRFARSFGEKTVVSNAAKPFELHFNREFNLGDEDLTRCLRAIGDSYDTRSEGRSSVEYLQSPMVDSVQGGVTIDALQFKGVVFASNSDSELYSGIGFMPEVFYSDPDGRVRRVAGVRNTPVGKCMMIEAVAEFTFCHMARHSLNSQVALVPSPVAWGRYIGGELGDWDTGFVVLGMPSVVPGREAILVRAAEEWASGRGLSAVETLFRQRSLAVRELHASGFLASGRHFGNTSFTQEGTAVHHDVGALNALSFHQFKSAEQFECEAFCQLVNAFTPRKICIPVPRPGSATRSLIMDRNDFIMQCGLESYFQDDPGGLFVLEEVETAFMEALKKPLRECESPFAKYFVMQFQDIVKSVPSWDAVPKEVRDCVLGCSSSELKEVLVGK